MSDVEQAFKSYLKANPDAGGDFTFFRAGWESANRFRTKPKEVWVLRYRYGEGPRTIWSLESMHHLRASAKAELANICSDPIVWRDGDDYSAPEYHDRWYIERWLMEDS